MKILTVRLSNEHATFIRRDGQSLPVRYQANPPHYGRLRGIIGRNEIMTMISKKIFVNSEEVGAKVVRESYGKLREHYPRFPQAEAIDMSPEDQAKFCLDFRSGQQRHLSVVY